MNYARLLICMGGGRGPLCKALVNRISQLKINMIYTYNISVLAWIGVVRLF